MRAFLLGILGLLALSGCSGYHLGSGGKLTFKTLYVPPVVNQSKLPQSVAIVSTRLRDDLLLDGRVTLVDNPDDADAVLSVVLVNYSRSVAATQASDTGLARKFDVTLDAEVSLRDNRQGKYLLEKQKISATREIFTDSGQLQAEYQAVPLLAETLSHNIISSALDTW